MGLGMIAMTRNELNYFDYIKLYRTEKGFEPCKVGEPTFAAAGSREKIDEMARRIDNCEPLFHDGDSIECVDVGYVSGLTDKTSRCQYDPSPYLPDEDRGTYPWPFWFDGTRRLLIEGVDYDKNLSIQPLVNQAARRMGLIVTTRKSPKGLWIEARGKKRGPKGSNRGKKSTLSL